MLRLLYPGTERRALWQSGMISVIIVNYHSALLTKRAVKALTQERKDIEIFVVDNTCSHEEKQLLANSLEDAGVRLIFNSRNEGFAKACNTAYALSRGEYIFLLNPDAYTLPGALTQLENFLAGHPEAGAVGPKIYWDNDQAFMLPPSISPSPANELFMQLTRQLKTFGLLYSCLYRWRAINAWRSSSPVRQKALSGGHVMLRRSAVDYSGDLFDERFFMYYEDSDLMYRLRQNGYTLYVEPKAGVIHNYTHNAGKVGLMAESRGLYFNKHFRNNLMLFISDKLSQLKNNAPQYAFIDMKITDKAVSINIPGPGTGEWLFEWSPNPSFIPAAGCFGKGAVIEFNKEAWKLLGPGIYFGRISNPACIAPRFIKWSWEIKEQ